MVIPASTIRIFSQLNATSGTATNSRRNSRTKPAALEPMAKKAVVGVGETGQHVEGHGDEFERNEQHREVIGRGGEHHPGERKKNERIILGNARFDAVREFSGHDEYEYSSDEEKTFEEQRKCIQRVTVVE